jgi:hypothetical protein
MPFQSENHYKIEQAFTLGGKPLFNPGQSRLIHSRLTDFLFRHLCRHQRYERWRSR